MPPVHNPQHGTGQNLRADPSTKVVIQIDRLKDPPRTVTKQSEGNLSNHNANGKSWIKTSGKIWEGNIEHKETWEIEIGIERLWKNTV